MDPKLFLADDAMALETLNLCDALMQRLVIQITNQTADETIKVFHGKQLDHPNDPNLQTEELQKNEKDDWKKLLDRNLLGTRD